MYVFAKYRIAGKQEYQIPILLRMRLSGKMHNRQWVRHYFKAGFLQLWGVEEISIPDTVTTIESGAFGGTGISEFAYPPHVTAINGLGDMPRLTRVEIGENAVSVTGMGNCPLLETLIIRATTPPTTDYWTLLNAPRIPNIYVPDTAVSAYKTASGWSKWAAYIKPLSEYNG